MSPRAAWLGGLLAVLLAGPFGRPAPAAGVGVDPVQALRVWVQRLDRFRSDFDVESESKLRELLDEVRLVRLGAPERARECDVALLETAAHRWRARPERARMRDLKPGMDREVLVSLLAIQRLERLLDGGYGDELARWLGLEVLGRPDLYPLEQRVAAADLFHGRFHPDTQSVLFATARAEEPLLRETAFRSLSGWEDAAVHLFVLEALERERVSLPIALAHLEATREHLGPQALDRLRAYGSRLLVASDWRDAIRALRLMPILDVARSAPLLIEALAIWTRRLEDGSGTLRVQHEVLRELKRISGRSIGAHPDRWNLWWKAVQEGRVEALEGDGARAVTAATFFGLRPVSDRVLFVVDRSGSMASGFGTTGRTRYEEAVDQLVGFTEGLGDDGRFGVTLFHSGATRWRSKLADANQANRKAARRWLAARTPEGGTELYQGLATALQLDRKGRVDTTRLAADTVIVLCDGRTAEGPGWVDGWLESVNDEAQLVFYCVEIGRGGDGTLQRLANGTGGDYIRIDG
ncbi:MAG: VWA domain-containing protein [Planctomycetota bacterium]